MSKARSKVAASQSGQVHTCTACRQSGPWSDSWEWFGSYCDVDGGRPILKTCSYPCREEIKRQGGAPRLLARIQRQEAA